MTAVGTVLGVVRDAVHDDHARGAARVAHDGHAQGVLVDHAQGADDQLADDLAAGADDHYPYTSAEMLSLPGLLGWPRSRLGALGRLS